jgi:hypothetical protein
MLKTAWSRVDKVTTTTLVFFSQKFHDFYKKNMIFLKFQKNDFVYYITFTFIKNYKTIFHREIFHEKIRKNFLLKKQKSLLLLYFFKNISVTFTSRSIKKMLFTLILFSIIKLLLIALLLAFFL